MLLLVTPEGIPHCSNISAPVRIELGRARKRPGVGLVLEGPIISMCVVFEGERSLFGVMVPFFH